MTHPFDEWKDEMWSSHPLVMVAYNIAFIVALFVIPGFWAVWLAYRFVFYTS